MITMLNVPGAQHRLEVWQHSCARSAPHRGRLAPSLAQLLALRPRTLTSSPLYHPCACTRRISGSALCASVSQDASSPEGEAPSAAAAYPAHGSTVTGTDTPTLVSPQVQHSFEVGHHHEAATSLEAAVSDEEASCHDAATSCTTLGPRPLRPKMPSAAAIQAASNGLTGLPLDSSKVSAGAAAGEHAEQRWGLPARTHGGAATPSQPTGFGSPPASSPYSTPGPNMLLHGASGQCTSSNVKPSGLAAAQFTLGAMRKQQFDAAKAVRPDTVGVQKGGRGEGREEGKRSKKKLPVLRTGDGRRIVKVANDTSASHLATAMFRLLLLKPRLVLVLGGLHPIHTTCRALALTNLLMNKQCNLSVAFTPLWMEPEDRKRRLKVWPYQVHVAVVPVSDEMQHGDISKVLDYGDDTKVRKGEKGIQEDRAHHVADILVSAIGAEDDAMIMAATHTEVLTTFHSMALCQRRLNQEAQPMSPSCTAYFEMLVTGNPNKKGILFYTEPCAKVLPARLPTKVSQQPVSKAPLQPAYVGPIGVVPVAAAAAAVV